MAPVIFRTFKLSYLSKLKFLKGSLIESLSNLVDQRGLGGGLLFLCDDDLRSLPHAVDKANAGA